MDLAWHEQCSSVHAMGVAISRNGRFVAIARPGAVDVVDVLGTAPRRAIAVSSCAMAWVGDELWIAGEHAIGRHRAARTGELAPIELGGVAAMLALVGTTGAIARRDDGATVELVVAEDAVAMRSLPAGRWFPHAGRHAIRVEDTGLELPCGARVELAGVRAATGLFGGRAVALWAREAIVVLSAAGAPIRRIETAPLDDVAFADQAGLAIGRTGEQLLVIDLRLGEIRARTGLPHATSAIAVDADARHIVLSGERTSLFTYDELFRRSAEPTIPRPDVPWEKSDDALPWEASEADDDEVAPLPDIVPRALARPPRTPVAHAGPPEARPFASPNEHLAGLLDLVAARAAVEIAAGWHDGRLSRDLAEGLPCEHEVLGLVGDGVGLAAEPLHRARVRLVERSRELAQRTLASLAAGTSLPFHDVAHDLGLSPFGTQLVLVAAAPLLRGEIARLYGVLAGLAGRAPCDVYLAEALIGDRDAVARELEPDAPLIARGAVRLDRTTLLVEEALLARMRGRAPRGDAALALDDVAAPREVVCALLDALAARDPDHPARVVLRGRRGAGRRTLAAALAGRAGRPIAAIDAQAVMRTDGAAGLARELARADLSGSIPVVSNLEAIDPSDAGLRAAVRDVLARHGGPLVVRTTPEGDLPIDPDHLVAALPPLSIGERTARWRHSAAAHGLGDVDCASLATRHRFGAGTIARVCAAAARRPGGATQLETLARQHTAVRLARVATRVERLPDWNQVTLLDDMRDSVRELIGRVRCTRTVYERWGFDRRITSARGLTALFYGPPGTGKTLVAGLVARELGLELWRVDLARVMSKWVGETERNLGEVFDAAEEGHVMLLFDEADSLFGKRTEVKSSNDRFANLETNYLLQRLDGFGGIAVLTSNLEASIDSAFKRRLSMRLYFPFPDEELRAELWATHVPPEVPCAGDLDFAELGRRFPLSGGYIRNSALRAAFLAAQEQRPLSQDHLLRAVHLEYRELGKLASHGRLE